MPVSRRTLLQRAGLAGAAATLTPLAPAAAAAGGPEALLPFLQNPAADAMTVCVPTRGVETVAIVADSPDGSNPRDVAVVAHGVPGSPWTIWKARITGLAAGSPCRYRVQTTAGGVVTATPPYDFTTPDQRDRELKVAVFNDIHQKMSTLEALLAHVRPADFEFTILNGDIIQDPGSAEGAIRAWNAYVRLLDGSRKPMLFVRGNHDARGGFAKHLGTLFDLPFLTATAAEAEQQWQWSLDVGPVHFLALDTGEDDDPKTDPASYKRPRFWEAYRRRQTAWLDRHLATPAVREARHRVFLSHIPLHDPAGWFSIVSRDEWSRRLAAADFHLMLAGHDHSWKFVPAGEEFVVRQGAYRGERDTAPLPVLIGGGPTVPEGTAILLRAGVEGLTVRMLDTSGRLLHTFSRRA